MNADADNIALIEAPPANAPPLGLPTIVPAQTFREFYAAPSDDAILDDIVHVLPRFITTGPDVLPGHTLCMQVIGHPHKKQTFLCLAQAPRGPRVYCVHLLTLFALMLDGTTNWDDGMFAYIGDISIVT
jgi:hypothetical protein